MVDKDSAIWCCQFIRMRVYSK
uniref:Uncharacterized protein n=1 Tax=Tetranychus urticae TaxID=32264 RepID=T1KGU4_TETUR